MNNRLLLRRMQATPPSIFEDATVAYSLRNLGLGVTNLIRVRRSSDNAEQDFTETEITDGTLTTFCGSGNGYVTIWYNQKDIQHASQNISTRQPKLVSNGSLVITNNEPSILFEGGQLLSVSKTININELSVYTAAKYNTNDTSYIWNYTSNDLGSNADFIANSILSTNVFRTITRNIGGQLYENQQTANFNQNLFIDEFSNLNLKKLVNAVETNEITDVSNLGLETIYIGAGVPDNVYSNSNIQELVIEENTINNDIVTNINNHYGI